MKLHELHVLQRQPGAQRHRVAVAGAGMGRSGREIGAAVAAGGEDGGLGAEPVNCPIVQLEAHDAAHCALGVADEIDGEILDEELTLRLQRLAVKRVQDGVPGAIGGGAGALGHALAEVSRHAAERALIDLARLGAGEWHAPMIQFIDRFRRVATHVFDRILVSEPVRTLDRVVHVPPPVVGAHVAEGSGDAALRGDRVRAGREHFRDACGAQTRLGAADARTQARAARANHHDIERVVGDRIGLAAERRRALRRRAVGRHRCPSS